MKGRSHHLPISEPLDDWVDGSWTVDCVCGVNFDDGEEMVNCDECGVWVHTRCSRFVKGEDSFVCDKCKSKNNRNNSEETEVAQLLVELPTKTIKMDNPCASGNGVPARHPFRLWTDIPIEERVHVQGVPGGDPALFKGLSSVFTPQLWKCAGYVPKKFNFQYREFPSWDENQEVNTRTEEETENAVDKGAGVLFSLSKQNILAASLTTLVGMKSRIEDGPGNKMSSSPKQMKKWDGEDIDVWHAQGGTKEQSFFRSSSIHSVKKKQEELGILKDRTGKKKAKATDREADSRKKGDSSKAVFTSTSDGKQLGYYNNQGVNMVKNDSQSTKNEKWRDRVLQEHGSDGCLVVENNDVKPVNIKVASDQHLDDLYSDVSRHKKDKAGQIVSARIERSPKRDDAQASLIGKNDVVISLPKCNSDVSVPLKEEGEIVATAGLERDREFLSEKLTVNTKTSSPSVENLAGVEATSRDENILEDAALEVNNNNILQDLMSDIPLSSVQPDVKEETDLGDNTRSDLNAQSLHEAKTVMVSSLTSHDNEVQDVDRSKEAVGDCHADKADELSVDSCLAKQELGGSESPRELEKGSLEGKQDSGYVEELVRSGRETLSPAAPPTEHKRVVSIGKSSTLSSGIATPKATGFDNTENLNPINKEHVVSSLSKKDSSTNHIVNHEDKHEIPRRIAKECPKSSATAAVRASHLNRITHASAAAAKRVSSDSKALVTSTSSRASLAHGNAITSGSEEHAVSLESHSFSAQRGEKFNQTNPQPLCKVNHPPSVHTTTNLISPATLSDEELALLLHQELNSSPRVPRVPRVRHAGSLPQLASPSATSKLMKRSTSSGVKDYGSFSRKKPRDSSKERSYGSREIDDEARKTEPVRSSPDHRRQDAGYAADASSGRELDNGSPKVVQCIKNIPPAPSTSPNSVPSSSTEANDQNLSSIQSSPRNLSDDDMATVKASGHRTLPGLIDEIMSKSRKMTYEELCDAVLPHWRTLRKHNGERYAYASHSQAVLDCLRNRNEWAGLVDRGPKTNSSRKRRKFDADLSTFESEDNENVKSKTAKEGEGKSFESHREEFPKGKRKARKRRRLALQGRGIKEMRKRRKADIMRSDDDFAAYSNSSEENIFSEDETEGRGSGTCPVGSEASASSCEMGNL